jgi:hypothetical protein
MVPRRLIRKLENLTDEGWTHIEHQVDQLRQIPSLCRPAEPSSFGRLVGLFTHRPPLTLVTRLPRPSMLTASLPPSETAVAATGTSPVPSAAGISSVPAPPPPRWVRRQLRVLDTLTERRRRRARRP